MMIELNLSFHRKARVWLDELPDASFAADSVLEELLQPAKESIPSSRQAAVEIQAPKGAVIIYGLLGAEFTPTSSGVLRIKVAFGRAENNSYYSPLIPKSEKTTAGLEKDFASDVLRSAVGEISRTGQVFSGDLTFGCAAQGAVGSNRIIFRQLGSVVAKLILLNNRQPAAEELIALLG
jgi:hypothetical protein